jgi:hypothetical protein
MKRCLFLLFAITLIQCKKDKNDNAIDLRKGLLAFFTLDDNFEDSTGNIPITIYSTQDITAVPDRHNRLASAMNFDGGKMSAPTDDWPANPLSISLWVKPKNSNNDDYLLASNQGAFGIYQSEDKLGMAISVPATNSAMATIGKGWIHVAGTYDGEEIRTYINGKLAASMVHAGEPDKTSQFFIGSYGSAAWKGSIDDVRFYNRVLSAEEIELLANL